MKWHMRLIIAVGVALGFGVISALVLTVADLHLTGHAQPSLNQATISIPGLGQHLSVSDLLLLAGIILPGLVTWLLLSANKADRR